MRREKDGTRGAAMILVLCVMAVFTALAFSLLLSAAVAARSAGKGLAEEKCKILAVSFGDLLDSALTRGEETPLQEYLSGQLSGGTWGYAQEPEENTRSFAAPEDGLPEGTRLEAALEWKPQTEPGQEPRGELTVTVTCRSLEQTHRVKAVYTLDAGRWSRNWRK